MTGQLVMHDTGHGELIYVSHRPHGFCANVPAADGPGEMDQHGRDFLTVLGSAHARDKRPFRSVRFHRL